MIELFHVCMYELMHDCVIACNFCLAPYFYYMKDNETNVFVSGNKDSVETVEKNLNANLPKAKTVKAEVKKNDLLKLM